MVARKRVKLDALIQQAKEEKATISLTFKKHKEGDVISYELLKNILSDFSVKEFMDAQTSLLVTQDMVSLYEELHTTIEYDQGLTSLLQGPSGVGKTTTLLYIGHMARLMGYLVFPVQARDFVNRSEPMSVLVRVFLRKWIQAVGDDMVEEIFGDDLFRYIVKIIRTDFFKGDEEKEIINIFIVIVRELRLYEAKPVVFLVDQCNAFHESPQRIKLYSDSEEMEITSTKNPVGAMFFNWNTFSVLRGGILFGYSSAFRLMPSATDGNAALFTKIKPMHRESFKIFVDFLVKQNQLAQECDCNDFFELCGGIPSEARVFGLMNIHLFDDKRSTFEQWKTAYMNARIPFFKARIQRLLDKEKLGPEIFEQSVSFASSLFVSENVVSAPDVWIADGLVASKGGFQKLICPAAENALLSVFDESNVIIRQAIDIFRNDSLTSWKRFELAVVALFRRSHGIPIEFQCTDIYGKTKKRMTITARLILHGGIIPPEAKSVPRNAIFIGVRNTPVVDFFIHDANGAQILIQASESSYCDHNAKYKPEDQDIKFYSAAARDPQPRTKLQYIYLTPNSSMMPSNQKRIKYCRKVVFLVAGDDMKRLFGGLFDFVK